MLELSTVVPSAFKAAVAFGISVSVLQIFPFKSSWDFTMSVPILFSICSFGPKSSLRLSPGTWARRGDSAQLDDVGCKGSGGGGDWAPLTHSWVL